MDVTWSWRLFAYDIPPGYVDKVDPYQGQCIETAHNLVADLALEASDYGFIFQSGLGPKKWLRPYIDKTIEALDKKGIKTLDRVCSSFSEDCLETLEEISNEGHEICVETSGVQLR